MAGEGNATKHCLLGDNRLDGWCQCRPTVEGVDDVASWRPLQGLQLFSRRTRDVATDSNERGIINHRKTICKGCKSWLFNPNTRSQTSVLSVG
jgi:hypothetical protein